MLYRYTSTVERIYPYARVGGGVKPVTAKPGMDPIELDEAPADGHWEAVKTTKPAKAAEERA